MPIHKGSGANFTHIFHGSKSIFRVYRGSVLIWESGQRPLINYFSSLQAGDSGIDLDTRPSGDISLYYETHSGTPMTRDATNLLHNERTGANIPIIYNVVSTPTNTWALGSGFWLGSFHNGQKRWVIDSTDNSGLDFPRAKAFSLSTGARLPESTNDIYLLRIAGASTVGGSWKDGCYAKNAFWLLNNNTLYYLNESNFAAVTENHINLNTLFGSGGWERVFTDGEDIWCIDNTRDWAYSLSATTRTRSHKDINLGSGTWYGGTVCKGGMYFLDAVSNRPILRVWTKQDRQRRSHKDFSLPTTGNPAYRGLDCYNDKIYAVDNVGDNLIERGFSETVTTKMIRIPQYDFDLGPGNWRGATVKDNLAYVIDDLAVGGKKYARNFDVSNVENVVRGQTTNDLELAGIGTSAKGIVWWDLTGSERFYVSDNTTVAKAYNSSLVPVSANNLTVGTVNIERLVRQKEGSEYTFYAIDNTTDRAIALDPATGSDYAPARTFSLGSGRWFGAEYIEGVGFFFYNSSARTRFVRHWGTTRSADSSFDLTATDSLWYSHAPFAGSPSIRGSFSKGNVIWFINDTTNRAHAFYVKDTPVAVATIPQPSETTTYRLTSRNDTGAIHKDLPIKVTQNLVISNFVRTGFRQSELPGRAGGLYSFRFRIKGTPRPNNFVFSGVISRTTDARHLTPVSGETNLWDFNIDLNIGANSGTLTVVATNGEALPGGRATATVSIS